MKDTFNLEKYNQLCAAYYIIIQIRYSLKYI